MALLEVRDLEVAFGDRRILRGVSFDLEEGKTLGVVGESGCGKSMTGFAVMGMLPRPGRIVGGSIRLDGRDLTNLPEKAWQEIRGDEIGLVMQDPFTSLNPMMRVGEQIVEAILLHRKIGRAAATKEAVGLLDMVGVPAPDQAYRKFPHQMSGGQRQRVVIAIAFACKPKVLIADEPTTALDVTLQAQILRLLRELQREEGTAVMLISHDIGAIGAVSDRVAVFYAGRVVEEGPAEAVLHRPMMPYTQGLLASLPRADATRLEAIAGLPPDLGKPIPGCPFAPRCTKVHDRCVDAPPLFPRPDAGAAACWLVESAVPLARG